MLNITGKVEFMTSANGWYCPDGPHWGINYGTSIPIISQPRFNSREEAEEFLRFVKDKKFWRQYESDFERISKKYGQYHQDFPEKCTSEEWNKWAFSPWECEEFEGYDWDGYVESIKELTAEMFETWKGVQIV